MKNVKKKLIIAMTILCAFLFVSGTLGVYSSGSRIIGSVSMTEPEPDALGHLAFASEVKNIEIGCEGRSVNRFTIEGSLAVNEDNKSFTCNIDVYLKENFVGGLWNVMLDTTVTNNFTRPVRLTNSSEGTQCIFGQTTIAPGETKDVKYAIWFTASQPFQTTYTFPMSGNHIAFADDQSEAVNYQTAANVTIHPYEPPKEEEKEDEKDDGQGDQKDEQDANVKGKLKFSMSDQPIEIWGASNYTATASVNENPGHQTFALTADVTLTEPMSRLDGMAVTLNVKNNGKSLATIFTPNWFERNDNYLEYASVASGETTTIQYYLVNFGRLPSFDHSWEQTFTFDDSTHNVQFSRDWSKGLKQKFESDTFFGWATYTTSATVTIRYIKPEEATDDNTEDENTEGDNTEGENTEGENTEGENTEGDNTEGDDTEGENTEGGNTEGDQNSNPEPKQEPETPPTETVETSPTEPQQEQQPKHEEPAPQSAAPEQAPETAVETAPETAPEQPIE